MELAVLFPIPNFVKMENLSGNKESSKSIFLCSKVLVTKVDFKSFTKEEGVF